MASGMLTSRNNTQFTRFAAPTEYKPSKANTHPKTSQRSSLLDTGTAAAQTSGPSSLRGTRNTTTTKKQAKSNKRHQPYVRPPARSSITPPSSPVRVNTSYSHHVHNFMDLAMNVPNHTKKVDKPLNAYTHYKYREHAGHGADSNSGNLYSPVDSKHDGKTSFDSAQVSPPELRPSRRFHQMPSTQELSSHRTAYIARPLEGIYNTSQIPQIQQYSSSGTNTNAFSQTYLPSTIPLICNQEQPPVYAADNYGPRSTLQTKMPSPQTDFGMQSPWFAARNGDLAMLNTTNTFNLADHTHTNPSFRYYGLPRIPLPSANQPYQKYTSQPLIPSPYDAFKPLSNPRQQLHPFPPLIQVPGVSVSTATHQQDQFEALDFHTSTTSTTITTPTQADGPTPAMFPVSDETLMALTEPFLMNWCLM